MARKNKNAGGRRFDTRLSFGKMARIMKLTPRQKITMLRYIRAQKRKGVDTKTK